MPVNHSPAIVTTGLTVYFANMTPGFQMLWIEKVEARIGESTQLVEQYYPSWLGYLCCAE